MAKKKITGDLIWRSEEREEEGRGHEKTPFK